MNNQNNKHFESCDLYKVTRDGEYYVLTYNNGDIYYWLNGKCQREGGPSTILYEGTKWWCWGEMRSCSAKNWDEFIIQAIIE